MSEIQEKDYEYQGNWEGYEVYMTYAGEGPDWEEAAALYREAVSDALYRHLAELALQHERQEVEKI